MSYCAFVGHIHTPPNSLSSVLGIKRVYPVTPEGGSRGICGLGVPGHGGKGHIVRSGGGGVELVSTSSP